MKKYYKPKTKAVLLDIQSLMAIGSPNVLTYSVKEGTKNQVLEVLTSEEPGFQFRAPNQDNVFDDDSYADNP